MNLGSHLYLKYLNLDAKQAITMMFYLKRKKVVVLNLPRKHRDPKTKSEDHSALKDDSIRLAVTHRWHI